jgi:hypothetical protein
MEGFAPAMREAQGAMVRGRTPAMTRGGSMEGLDRFALPPMRTP